MEVSDRLKPFENGRDLILNFEWNSVVSIKEDSDAILSGSLIVGINVFCHLREVKALSKEINRTNRKWRRKLNAEKNTF
jgi:hypothetical protein